MPSGSRATCATICGGLVGDARAATVALGLAAMIDGLWLSFALNHRDLGPESARALARDHLHRQLAG